jgi:hypothetical protein
MDKSEVSRLTAYLEIVEQLMKQHIEEEDIYKNLSVNAARPLIAAKGDERTDMLNTITAQLKGGEKVIIPKKLEYSNKKPQTKPESTGAVQSVKKETSQNNPSGFPEHVPPAAVTVPLKGDPDAPCMQPLRIEPDAMPEKHINPGASVIVSPVVINDTMRESPFKTAAQVLAHDKDPLGIDAPAETKPASVDPVKAAREEMERRAVAFVDLLSSRHQLLVQDIIRDHGGLWKVKDVLAIGIDALADQKKHYKDTESKQNRRQHP